MKYFSFHYHCLINMCVFYLPCTLAQSTAEALQFMILSRNMCFIFGLEAKSDTVLSA